MALERLRCEVRFIGYHEFLGRMTTPARIAISRSERMRRLIEPFALRAFNNSAKQAALNFRPDLALVIKGEAVLTNTVDYLSQQMGAITALWYPDDPRYFLSLSKIIAPHYDFVFTSSERCVPTYLEAGAKHVDYLPFACDPSVHRPIELTHSEKKTLACDICFVGTFSRKRAKVVGALERAGFRVKVWGPYWRYFKRGSDSRGPVFGPQMTRIFNAARIVLNVHDDTDMGFKPNMRIFEAAGCRSLVLTDNAFGLGNLFRPGEEILCYSDMADLLNIAGRYIASSADGSTIATKAYQRAHSDHTYDQRLRLLIRAVALTR